MRVYFLLQLLFVLFLGKLSAQELLPFSVKHPQFYDSEMLVRENVSHVTETYEYIRDTARYNELKDLKDFRKDPERPRISIGPGPIRIYYGLDRQGNCIFQGFIEKNSDRWRKKKSQTVGIHRKYDKQGRLIWLKEYMDHGDGKEKLVLSTQEMYQYDSEGILRLLVCKFFKGRIRSEYRYSSDGRLEGIDSDSKSYSSQVTYTYDTITNSVQEISDSDTTIYYYDDQNRLIRLEEREANEAFCIEDSYEYDKEGRLLRHVRRPLYDTTSLKIVAIYIYDHKGFLIRKMMYEKVGAVKESMEAMTYYYHQWKD